MRGWKVVHVPFSLFFLVGTALAMQVHYVRAPPYPLLLDTFSHNIEDALRCSDRQHRRRRFNDAATCRQDISNHTVIRWQPSHLQVPVVGWTPLRSLEHALPPLAAPPPHAFSLCLPQCDSHVPAPAHSSQRVSQITHQQLLQNSRDKEDDAPAAVAWALHWLLRWGNWLRTEPSTRPTPGASNSTRTCPPCD